MDGKSPIATKAAIHGGQRRDAAVTAPIGSPTFLCAQTVTIFAPSPSDRRRTVQILLNAEINLRCHDRRVTQRKLNLVEGCKAEMRQFREGPAGILGARINYLCIDGERCSESARSGVRLDPGIVVSLAGIPKAAPSNCPSEGSPRTGRCRLFLSAKEFGSPGSPVH
jgi:hypothetical protein